jgi:hypothetical protein
LPNTTGIPTSTGRVKIHTKGRRRTEVIRNSRQPPPTPPRPPTTSAALRPRDRSAKLECQAYRGRQLPQTTAKLASGAVMCDENHPRHLVGIEWSPGTDTQQRATAIPCRSEKLDHRHHHPWSRLARRRRQPAPPPNVPMRNRRRTPSTSEAGRRPPAAEPT